MIVVSCFDSASTYEEVLRVLGAFLSFYENKSTAIRTNVAEILHRACLNVHRVVFIALYVMGVLNRR